MNVIQPRDIINRKEILAELEELVSWSGYTPKTQPRVLDIFKCRYKNGWTEIKRRFLEDEITARKVYVSNTYLVDQMIRIIYEFTTTWVYPLVNPTKGEQLSLVATGGYGRGGLAPFSDIDLMFMIPYKMTAHSEQVIEFTLYMLWDIGLKVGQATRSVEEALRLSKEDLTIRTSLLEARFIWGNRDLFTEMKNRMAEEIIADSGPEFVEGKLEERDGRHEKMGDTRYVLEPNIKDGKGGLRDLQTLFWIAKYIYQVSEVKELKEKGVLTKADVNLFTKAENFLWTVRCHLHYLTGRPEERLTFDIQKEISACMGYTDRPGVQGVERFMKHYFLIAKDVGSITRILCSVLEEQQKKQSRPAWMPNFRFLRREIEGFTVDSGRLGISDRDDLAKDPIRILKLFRLSQKHNIDIHPDALRLVKANLKRVNGKLRRNPDANTLFMEMLRGSAPEVILMKLNESGVLGRFIPDFGRVIAQMQYDMYHVYTVDEHTIRAIGILNGIETGRLRKDHPVSCDIIGEVQSLNALYLAVFFHDIAKGRGGDHSVLGAGIARRAGPRLGLSDWETETVEWLVAHHLLMSNTALKRDIYDPKTVTDFVDIVQSPERLRLLLILTVADTRAVGPNVWNGWKAELLRQLYSRAQQVMQGGRDRSQKEEKVAHIKSELAQILKEGALKEGALKTGSQENWSEADVESHFDRGHSQYWLANDLKTLIKHARIIQETETGSQGFQIELEPQQEWSATEVIIYAPDHSGFFAAIAGALALSTLTIVDAKVQTLSNGMALDTFLVQEPDGSMVSRKPRLDKLRRRIAQAIQGQYKPARELEKSLKGLMPSRTQVFKVPPHVLVDNKASRYHTVIEINGRDRPGLLYDVTSAISDIGLQISSAHIATYGERVVDVFYVKDVFGMKVDRDDKVSRIKKSLLEAIEGTQAFQKARNNKTKNLKPAEKMKKPPAKQEKPTLNSINEGG